MFGGACSQAEVLANSNFQDTHNRVQASAPSRLQDYPQQWPPAQPSTSARPLGVCTRVNGVRARGANAVIFIQRHPARSRCPRFLPRRSDLMSCSRFIVSDDIPIAGHNSAQPLVQRASRRTRGRRTPSARRLATRPVPSPGVPVVLLHVSPVLVVEVPTAPARCAA